MPNSTPPRHPRPKMHDFIAARRAYEAGEPPESKTEERIYASLDRLRDRLAKIHDADARHQIRQRMSALFSQLGTIRVRRAWLQKQRAAKAPVAR